MAFFLIASKICNLKFPKINFEASFSVYKSMILRIFYFLHFYKILILSWHAKAAKCSHLHKRIHRVCPNSCRLKVTCDSDETSLFQLVYKWPFYFHLSVRKSIKLFWSYSTLKTNSIWVYGSWEFLKTQYYRKKLV